MLKKVSSEMQRSKPVEVRNRRSVKEEYLVTNPLGLVLRVSRVAGMGPLVFKRRARGWTVAVSPILCIVTYIRATVLNIAAFTGEVLDMQAKPSDAVTAHTPTRRIAMICDFVIVMLIANVAAYGAPRRLEKTLCCWKRIQKINKAASHTKPSSNVKASAVFVVWAVAMITLLTADYWNQLRTKETITLAICLDSSYYYAYCLLFLLEMQYVFSAFEVTRTVAAVGDAIEDLSQLLDAHYARLDVIVFGDPSTSMKNKSVNPTIDKMAMTNYDADSILASTLESTSANIRRLASLYEDACDVLRQLDDCHGVGVLLLLLSFLLHLVVSLYYTIVLFESPDDRIFDEILQFVWVLHHFLSTVAIMEPSYKTELQDSRVRLLISRMVLQAPKGPMFQELAKFSRFLLTNKAVYCPLRVCSLSRPLVTSIIGSVVTYLVIIVQFQLSEKENQNTD